MPELTESERAALWVNQRIHELNVRRGIATKVMGDPTAIAELYRDWESVLAHLEERQAPHDTYEDHSWPTT